MSPTQPGDTAAVRPQPAPLENTPDRAVELLAEPEARQGRTRWRKLRRVSNYWDFEPVMLPCVLVPDLVGFDWPAARLPEFIANRPSMSDDFLKAALPPSCSRTGRCVAHGVYPALRWSRFHPTTTPPLNARCRSDRFDWPAGGTEEFLGRWSARINSRHTEAKGVRADPLYVFGAVGRTGTPGVVLLDRDGNRNDRTSRCRHEGRALVTRGTTVQNRSSSSREFRGARLDFSVHIWVRRSRPDHLRLISHFGSDFRSSATPWSVTSIYRYRLKCFSWPIASRSLSPMSVTCVKARYNVCKRFRRARSLSATSVTFVSVRTSLPIDSAPPVLSRPRRSLARAEANDRKCFNPTNSFNPTSPTLVSERSSSCSPRVRPVPSFRRPSPGSEEIQRA